jgi:hypothetical protein
MVKARKRLFRLIVADCREAVALERRFGQFDAGS